MVDSTIDTSQNSVYTYIEGEGTILSKCPHDQ